ncbi:ATP-dependent DNA helicase RecG [Bifidobacterium xylocopae]|uniref:ATP-dependent DNA helicase RecG n=1 Tax=Bifidobacterium xylocopae TaxID=2493119 RepID=A0A366KDG3_9BIFI|nr:ATP-dependent DNA helicase RecG [Bifidobacterium xylocopae]RBP99744.1 ATP-dependent DNA helicase RecG [Bifidobacterium xylocopae]
MPTSAAISADSAISNLLSNKRRVSALKSLGLETVGDALTYYPFRVTDPVPVCPIGSVELGAPAAFAARVEQARVVPMGGRRGFRLDATVSDDDFAQARGAAGSKARLVFFSHRKSYMDWMIMRLKPGAQVVLAGDPSVFNDQLQFTHPEVLLVSAGDGEAGDPVPASIRPDADSVDRALAKVSRPRPVYHASSRISSEHIHDTILGFIRLLAARGQEDAGGGGASGGIQSGSGTSSPVPDGQIQEPPIDAGAFARAVPDVLPEPVRMENGLEHRAQAFLGMHDPDTVDDFRRALRTLRFEEAFVSQTALLRSREDARAVSTYSCPPPGPDSLVRRFVDSLPFELTGGQRAVIGRIQEDMAQEYPMQRLLQGEVGSGKTVVALAAMLQAVDAGYQAVLVAPTQVLAEQHYESIGRMLDALASGGSPAGEDAERPDDDGRTHVNASAPVPLVLLTGGMRLAERRRALAVPASGEPCIVIATHAAFSKTFQAPHLALAVIDEQHRFGVEQRETLRRKSDKAPHLLVMTATPIPRTAAMTWFGDLDISLLTELPGGRKPVRTFVVPEADARTMAAMFLHIRKRIEAGERAYVVCPRIEEDGDDAALDTASKGKGKGRTAGDKEEGDFLIDPYGEEEEGGEPQPPLHSVEEMSRRLSSLPQFAGIGMASLTGRDDDEAKTRVMADFSSGKTPVLVATTVIEVGVDVPEASVIVIFDADRFGLSQLHQLRGRVGRGGTDSWAFLISRAEPGSPAARRLEVIRTSTDGAEIAEADIEIRGAGDVLGDAQSGGRSSLKLLRVVKDAKVIARAREQAQALLAKDPKLTGEVELAGAALDFMRGNEAFLTST